MPSSIDAAGRSGSACTERHITAAAEPGTRGDATVMASVANHRPSAPSPMVSPLRRTPVLLSKTPSWLLCCSRLEVTKLSFWNFRFGVK